MKALSIHPKYADEIARGVKDEEYRVWQTPHRGDLLICASTFNDGPNYVRGYALCVVNLSDIYKKYDEFTWYLDNVRMIEPFPVKGKLHLYDVDDSLIKPLLIKRKPASYDDARKLWLAHGLCSDDDKPRKRQ